MGEYADMALDESLNGYWNYDDYLEGIHLDDGCFPIPIKKKRKYENMAGDRTTVYVPGYVYWAKIIGDKALHDNYDGDGREWSYELVPDDTTFLKDASLLDRLKDKTDAKNPDKGAFIILKKPEFDKDGNKNEPFKVIDNTGDETKPWDNRLIGNGTRVVAKLQIVNWGKGKKKSIYSQALRIEDLVAYEGADEFAGYDGDAKAAPKKGTAGKGKAKAPTPELDDIGDDEIPF